MGWLWSVRPAEEDQLVTALMDADPKPVGLRASTADDETQRRIERGFDHLTYEDAGHFITPPALPKSHRMFGGTPAGLARADRDSWPRVLETLAAGL